MIGDTFRGAGTNLAVLDGTVLDALGQLQGKYDAEFVVRIIAMFMETALVLLIRLKEGVANGDIAALHRASHALNVQCNYRSLFAGRPLRTIGIACARRAC